MSLETFYAALYNVLYDEYIFVILGRDGNGLSFSYMGSSSVLNCAFRLYV